jgi:hypothetical protein
MNASDFLDELERQIGTAPEMNSKAAECVDSVVARTIDWLRWCGKRQLLDDMRAWVTRRANESSR